MQARESAGKRGRMTAGGMRNLAYGLLVAVILYVAFTGGA
jgi:hypothetical protein